MNSVTKQESSVSAGGTQRRRPRLLMSAYACRPNHGSEPGVGWNRALQAAQNFDTWVITEDATSGSAIRTYLREHSPIPGLEFVFIPKSPWINPLAYRLGLYHAPMALLRWWHLDALFFIGSRDGSMPSCDSIWCNRSTFRLTGNRVTCGSSASPSHRGLGAVCRTFPGAPARGRFQRGNPREIAFDSELPPAANEPARPQSRRACSVVARLQLGESAGVRRRPRANAAGDRRQRHTGAVWPAAAAPSTFDPTPVVGRALGEPEGTSDFAAGLDPNQLSLELSALPKFPKNSAISPLHRK